MYRAEGSAESQRRAVLSLRRGAVGSTTSTLASTSTLGDRVWLDSLSSGINDEALNTFDAYTQRHT